jgi:hypothetical protein
MRYDGERPGLSDELRKKAAACKTPEELLELAKKEGYKLLIPLCKKDPMIMRLPGLNAIIVSE